MAYVPKNRIQTNLYTAGEEFYIPKINPNYIGYYYKLYTGEYFTGKNPDDKPNNTLLLIEDYNQSSKRGNQTYIINNNPNYVYGSLKNIDLKSTISTPQLFYTQPTKQNYKLGEFRRYFCKKRNEFIYLEISQEDYKELTQQSSTIDFKNWAPFNIPWTLVGEAKQVYYTNQNITLLKEKNNSFYGFSKYLREEYLKYYKS